MDNMLYNGAFEERLAGVQMFSDAFSYVHATHASAHSTG